MFLSKELKNKIKEYEKQLTWEDKKKKELVGKNMDYQFIQVLLDKINDNPNITVSIHLKDGTVINMGTKQRNQSFIDSYDGEPSDIEIR